MKMYTPSFVHSLLRSMFLAGLAVLPVVASAGVAAGGLTNPIDCNTLAACITKLVQYVLGLAAIVALAFIVYGGFLYITSAGNEDQLKSGKNAIYGAVVGLVVIGLAFAIVEFVASALGAGGGGGGQNIRRPQL